MRKIRSKLTYANVMVTILAFVVLGGATAFAATKLAKNSVGTKQIKNSAVTAAKIKKGTITGTQINLAKLGTVPSATNAATANTATTASTANALAAMEPTRLVGASGQPPFLDGSSNFEAPPFKLQPVGFYKDHDNIVHLTGTPKVGTEVNPVPGLIFTLPPGYRPASGVTEIYMGTEKTAIFIFGSNTVLAGHELSGDVFTEGAEGKPEFLGGITFRAES